jgi:PadR family transcriptional regulator, regulatory protein PadR
LKADGGEWNAQLRRGVLELCILSIIERAPAYGYQIISEMAVAPQLAASEGTIYPLLRRLKRDGALETSWEESGAGPPRQYYRLTDHGRTMLASMRSEWAGLVAAMQQYVEGREAVYEH